MAVTRAPIKCLTCSGDITIRVSLSHDSRQEHAFLCPNCDENITLGLDLDQAHATSNFRYVENCESAPDYADGAAIVNLNSEFVITEGELHQDMSFGWMPQVKYFEGLTGEKVIGPDVFLNLGGVPLVTEVWKSLRTAWSLSSNNQTQLADQALKKYPPNGAGNDISLTDAIQDFCLRLLAPKKRHLVDDAAKCLVEIRRQHKDEYDRFLQYYESDLQAVHLSRYFSIFSDYFRDYPEYSQTILYVKNEVPVPEGCMATSSGFENTKLFYGSAYEHYTSNLVVLACLNNLSEGREFQDFNGSTLEYYMKSHKANRGKPFESNSAFAAFLDPLDSRIRNASHHGALISIKKRRYVQFQSGGKGAVHEMSYSHYLELCTHLLISSAALLLLESAVLS